MIKIEKSKVLEIVADWIAINHGFNLPPEVKMLSDRSIIVIDDFVDINNRVDKHGIILTNGDIIDINQTVNGYSTFIIMDIKNLIVCYFADDKIQHSYQYDVKGLLELHKPYDSSEKEIQIIGKWDFETKTVKYK